MQVGNSVPPQMSNTFAKVIKKYIWQNEFKV
jgi:site-specific DNA-cytosine methylase